MFAQQVSYGAALTAGLLSFLSPCVLPLIPSYFSFITGMNLDELTESDNSSVRKKLILSTLAFVSGFSAVFIFLGGAVSLMGQQLNAYQDIVRIAGGGVIIVFGVHLAGILRIPFLDYEKKVEIKNKPVHLFGIFIVGMAFGAGWSPCYGAQLGMILAIAATEGSVAHGIGLLTVYSLGMAVPFILMSVFINYMLAFIKKAKDWIRFITVASGVLMIIAGLALVFNKLNVVVP
jgi:cytochrome c-type biogenesis protein